MTYLNQTGLQRFHSNLNKHFADANLVANLIQENSPDTIADLDIAKLTAFPQNYTIVFQSSASSRESGTRINNCVFDNFTFSREVSHSSDTQGNFAEVILLDGDNNEITVQLEGYATDTNGSSRYSPASSIYQNSDEVHTQNISNALNQQQYVMGYGYSDMASIKSYFIIRFVTPILRSKLNSMQFGLSGHGPYDNVSVSVRLFSSAEYPSGQPQFTYNRSGANNSISKIFEDVEY